MHKRKKGCKCKKTTKPMRSYRSGGMGTGARALVHKGEMIIKSPFRKP